MSALPYAPDLWERARDDYLCGETAAEVCRRHGVSRSQFYAQARAGGWRRADQPGAAEFELPPPEGAPPPTPELAAQALARAGWATQRGRLAEARGWARLAADLRALAMSEVGAETWPEALRRHADPRFASPQAVGAAPPPAAAAPDAPLASPAAATYADPAGVSDDAAPPDGPACAAAGGCAEVEAFADVPAPASAGDEADDLDALCVRLETLAEAWRDEPELAEAARAFRALQGAFGPAPPGRDGAR